MKERTQRAGILSICDVLTACLVYFTSYFQLKRSSITYFRFSFCYYFYLAYTSTKRIIFWHERISAPQYITFYWSFLLTSCRFMFIVAYVSQDIHNDFCHYFLLQPVRRRLCGHLKFSAYFSHLTILQPPFFV